MKTILFTWNPKRWQWDDLPRAVAETNVEGKFKEPWSCGVSRNISAGDRAFLIKLGKSPKGLIGSGVVIGSQWSDLHWNEAKAARGEMAFYVDIMFDVLSETPILDESILSKAPFSEHNWYPQNSGTSIPAKIASKLEKRWVLKTGVDFEPTDKDLSGRLHREGTKRTSVIEAYERSPAARQECIDHYGPKCCVCELNFSERYGDIGDGFIHVHHLVPIAEIREEYLLDPVNDLRPVCPNCHAMLHKKTPPYTPDELRAKLNEV